MHTIGIGVVYVILFLAVSAVVGSFVGEFGWWRMGGGEE